MRRLVLGTAGHIDHGKTALCRALTGRDTDRLPEEHARGISIDLGFAHIEVDPETIISIVDVPGHERFIKNMVAGATGVDAVMLVVAADEGIMPQTREHLHIMSLLGIESGFAVITKVDLVDDEWLTLVDDDVRTGLAGTFLEDAPVIHASSATGQGIDLIRCELEQLLERTRSRRDDGLPRLPIDRVFTVRGFGTVVTGTLVSGFIRPSDRMSLMPGDRGVRVRTVEVHDREVEAASPGERAAVNLGGVERNDVERGQVLTVPGYADGCLRFSARLRLLPSVIKPIGLNTRVRVHIGTDEVMARCIPLDRDQVKPGDSALVRFNLERPAVAVWGDRYIVRSYSPQDTIGGGTVLETERRRRRKDPATLAALAARETDDPAVRIPIVMTDELALPVTVDDVSMATGFQPEVVTGVLARLTDEGAVVAIDLDIPLYLHREALGHIADDIIDGLTSYLTSHPLVRGMGREQLRQERAGKVSARGFGAILGLLSDSGRLELKGSLVALPGHEPRLTEQQRELLVRMEDEFRSGGFSPPGRDDLAAPGAERDIEPLLGLLVADGVLIRVSEDIWFHREALDRARKLLAEHFAAEPELSVAVARDLLGTSRRYVLPLLNYFDDSGVTRRRGDYRARGPALTDAAR